MVKKASLAQATVSKTEPVAFSIDDIFASSSKLKLPSTTTSSSKGKAKASIPPSGPLPTGDGSIGASRTKKKKKTVGSFIPPPAQSSTSRQSSKPKLVETILDPSIVATPPPVPVPTKLTKEPGNGAKRDRKEAEEDELFRDSRGDGPRRKTEEGFLIFKEAELKINPEAGGRLISMWSGLMARHPFMSI